MAVVNSSKLSFYSGWNIEKIVTKGQVSVSLAGYGSSGQVADLTPYPFTFPPKVIALISWDGVNWFQSGGGVYTTSLDNRVVIEITTTAVRVRSIGGPTTPTIKYWVLNSGISG